MKAYDLRPSMSDADRAALAPYPSLLQELLYHRGITSKDEAELFISPQYDLHLHDPFLMKDMDVAVTRILAGMAKQEKIVIYTDYDCDGIPGGVILHDFFKAVGYEPFVNYIPHRHLEGYGLNTAAIDRFNEEQAALIVTVDVGITDVEAVAHANTLGIDVIVTDHHLPGSALPPAIAVVNPKRADDSYPFDMLCGAGIAFKLVQALLAQGDFSLPEGKEKWLLDMAGLSTIADMVPLHGENRVLAYYGLKVLRKSPRVGLMKLCRKMKVAQQHITEDDIGFMIGPRINAASRMGVPMEAFKLLTTRDDVEADTLSKYLDSINNERKGVVAAMAKEIKKRLRALPEIRDVIVMGNTQWKPALLGLAANAVAEEYNRPVFLWGREGSDFLKGSCRSGGSVSVVDLMNRARESFIECGGHAASGGFSILSEKLHTLEEVLCSAFQELQVIQKDEIFLVDKVLTPEEVTWQTYASIEKLAPFGMGNPKPVFLFRSVVISEVKEFGKENKHLELRFARSSGKPVSAIGFFLTPESFAQPIVAGEKIDLVATMEKSMFRGFPELRLRIVDII